MTATTKEQRATASLYIEKHTAGQATFPAHFIIALLSDSERLAAIEAVTGDEVRELVPELRRRGDGFCVNVKAAMPNAEPNPIEYRVADALFSLSAKVAEQAEENRASLAEIDRINAIWQEQARIIREQAEEIERLRALAEANAKSSFDMCDMAKATEAERDTLRRLLTETAVPALEYYGNQEFGLKARDALSTIRARIEGSPAAPQPARCSTCDDTLIIYGHSSFETSCPECSDADAEAGLAMLGGDGR